MIKIKRSSRPAFYNTDLYKDAQRRLDEDLSIQSQKRLEFNLQVFTELQQDVATEFNHKCAYCESALYSGTHGSVDNFRPRTGARDRDDFYPEHYGWLAYEWRNLYMVCAVCSKYKRDLFPLLPGSRRAAIGSPIKEVFKENILLVDPCIDNPDEHFVFMADGSIQGLTEKGIASIEVFGLNRNELVKERLDAVDEFNFLWERSINSKDRVLKKEMNDYIRELLSDHPRQMYAGAIRKAARERDVAKRNPPKLGADLISFAQISILADDLSSINSVLPDVFKPGGTFQLNNNNFSIKSVEISNFKSISNITFSVEPEIENTGQEPWLLMLGDNGIGKSSILQAIALTLCGSKARKGLKIKPAEVLRWGEKSGFVKIISYESNNPVELYFDEHKFTSSLELCPTFLLGYGSTRLLPKGTLKSSVNKYSNINIQNLFDYSVALADVNTWLKKLPEQELNTRIFPALIDLLDYTSDYAFSLENGKLKIFDGTYKHAFDTVSDGFKSVVALACDIMKSLSSDIASYHSTQGIVLVDELGNHLHPRWRMKIVGALRRAFPQLQFIVSSHEPLCLRGLKHGEVTVLLRDNQKIFRMLDKTLLPDHNLLKVDQLLTSDLFGLINTLDEETEKKFTAYYTLLSKHPEERTADDNSRIQAYTTELANKELSGSTPQDQVLYQLVNEVYVKNLQQEGFKTKQEIKTDTINEVKGMIDINKNSWL